jgi:polyhydroxyalkanoate synthesis repressor PhaR
MREIKERAGKSRNCSIVLAKAKEISDHSQLEDCSMSDKKDPTIVKKYANRRLYNTGTSTYVTLDDLADMVRRGEDFKVVDAKTGDDLTRTVLTQIIFEEESKTGQNLLPLNFLRQLIRFYGDSMQMMVPSYLDFSMSSFMQEQDKLKEQMKSAIMPSEIGKQAFGALEEQAKRNMSLFQDAFAMFNPFASAMGKGEVPNTKTGTAKTEAVEADDLKNLRRQMEEMQARLNAMSKE